MGRFGGGNPSKPPHSPKSCGEPIVYSILIRYVKAGKQHMSTDEEVLHEILTSASLGQTAYRTWAFQARRERRFNIARLLEALGASKLARAEHVFRQLGEVGTTAHNVKRA